MFDFFLSYIYLTINFFVDIGNMSNVCHLLVDTNHTSKPLDKEEKPGSERQGQLYYYTNAINFT